MWRSQHTLILHMTSSYITTSARTLPAVWMNSISSGARTTWHHGVPTHPSRTAPTCASAEDWTPDIRPRRQEHKPKPWGAQAQSRWHYRTHIRTGETRQTHAHLHPLLKRTLFILFLNYLTSHISATHLLLIKDKHEKNNSFVNGKPSHERTLENITLDVICAAICPERPCVFGCRKKKKQCWKCLCHQFGLPSDPNIRRLHRNNTTPITLWNTERVGRSWAGTQNQLESRHDAVGVSRVFLREERCFSWRSLWTLLSPCIKLTSSIDWSLTWYCWPHQRLIHALHRNSSPTSKHCRIQSEKWNVLCNAECHKSQMNKSKVGLDTESSTVGVWYSELATLLCSILFAKDGKSK